MYIYDEETGYMQGPISATDNNKFSSAQINGDRITIELHGATEKNSEISIDQVVHGYSGGYGDAASCNIDINCSQGNTWQDESNSVALVVLGNGDRHCSGSLINNTCGDYASYFLTAFHCLDTNLDGVLSQLEKEEVEDWSFRFQYKNEACNGNDDDAEYITYSGAKFKSGYSGTDFVLLKLDNDVVEGLSMAGWSRSTTASSSGASMTHPKGDLMKIGLYNQAPTTQSVNELKEA